MVTASSKQERLSRTIGEVPGWFHSIDLGNGVVTPGVKGGGHQHQLDELEAMRLPDLTGKSVLDIGAWDGFYSFEAERRGASRVVAMDHYVWSIDFPQANAEQARLEPGTPLPMPHLLPGVWRPDTLPGKRGFDLAHEALDSGVEALVADFMDVDIASLGRFDVVFYMGVLYHMRDPLGALTRVAGVTGELAVIESQAMAVPGYEEVPLFRFLESDELNSDPTNWWVPNAVALQGVCRAAGFREVELITAPEPAKSEGVTYYRLIIHARP